MGRPEIKRGLVVAEGTETERQYIERLGQHIRRGAAVVSVKVVGVGKDPLEVVTKCLALMEDAERKEKGYDWCVCLVDRDSHTTISDAATLAAKHGLLLLVTNLKFEMWLLWHVADVRAPRSSRELDQLMRKHNLLEGKNLSLRFPIDKVDAAMRIAELVDPELNPGRVGPDPSSAVPVPVRLMRGE
jgi:hypothetical protein